MLKAGISKSKQDHFEAAGGPVVGTPRWKTSSSKTTSSALDTTMQVNTPENISFHYQLAGPFRRLFAYFLDIAISLGAYAILCTVIGLCFFLLGVLAEYIGASAVLEAVQGIFSGLTAIGWFFIYWFYGAYMETQFNGQTLGKRITKMRVITIHGHAIDGAQATLRNFFRLLDVMPMVSIGALFMIEPTDSEIDQLLYFPFIPTCIFGLIVMTINRKYQRIGDLVANTVVVNEEQNRMPSLAAFSDPRVPQLADLIPTSFIVPASMAQAIAQYVEQRRLLLPQRASEIASHLARPLLEKFNIPADTDHDLFVCALYHKTFSTAQLDSDQTDALSGQQQLNQAEPEPIQIEQSEKEIQMTPDEFRINT